MDGLSLHQQLHGRRTTSVAGLSHPNVLLHIMAILARQCVCRKAARFIFLPPYDLGARHLEILVRLFSIMQEFLSKVDPIRSVLSPCATTGCRCFLFTSRVSLQVKPSAPASNTMRERDHQCHSIGPRCHHCRFSSYCGRILFEIITSQRHYNATHVVER